MRAAGLVIDSRRYASSTCTTAPSFMVSVLPNSPLHVGPTPGLPSIDRKSTRLNSSHIPISYAVFCLKKKNSARPGQIHRKHKGTRYDAEQTLWQLVAATGDFFRLALRIALPDGDQGASFFFNDTATTEIYTLSLHDALPI